jgi:hypothetical protein
MDGQPGDKSPGYYRLSLRDEVKTGFQSPNCRALRGADSLAKRIQTLGWAKLFWTLRARGGLVERISMMRLNSGWALQRGEETYSRGSICDRQMIPLL